MTALSADVNLSQKDGELVAHPVVASDIIYKGALVMNNAAGYLAPCSAEAGAKFAGIAHEKCDNSAGAAGAKKCKVDKVGSFLMSGSGFAQTDVGLPVYASDDATITKTYAANLPKVGFIEEFVSSTQVWVKINGNGDMGLTAIASLAQDISATYVEAEVQAISDKVDAILAALRAADIIQG